MVADVRDEAAAVLRRAEALAEAAEVLGRYRDDPTVTAAATTAERARQRLGHGTDHTVVAVAGQTGAGKSSLVNALVGADVSRVAVTRPTTSAPQAVVFGGGADALLDWLEVRDRHVADADDRLDGLVLVDLPDVDSIEDANRAEAARLIALADLLVVVTDPQKYADQVLHEHVLAPLADHDGVVRVVLNKVDLLDEDGLATCRDDLRRLVAADGLPEVEPLVASATTGRGVDRLRDVLADAVVARRAAIDRLAADLRAASAPLAPTGAGAVGEQALVRTGTAGLVDAVGAPQVAAVVAAQHRHDGAIATGWPVTRWVLRWRRAPLRDVPALGRRRIATDAVRATLRDVGEEAGEGLGAPWDRIVRDAARGLEPQVIGALDRVTTTGVEALRRRPAWWRAVAALQGLLVATTVVGGLWLLAIVLGESLLLLDLEAATPRWRGLPWPLLGVLGGLAGGWLVAVLASLGVRAGARRTRRRSERALRTRVAELTQQQLVDPLLEVRAQHHRVAELLAVAAGD